MGSFPIIFSKYLVLLSCFAVKALQIVCFVTAALRVADFDILLCNVWITWSRLSILFHKTESELVESRKEQGTSRSNKSTNLYLVSPFDFVSQNSIEICGIQEGARNKQEQQINKHMKNFVSESCSKFLLGDTAICVITDVFSH